MKAFACSGKGFSVLIGIFKGQQHFPGTRGAFGNSPEYDILIREILRSYYFPD